MAAYLVGSYPIEEAVESRISSGAEELTSRIRHLRETVQREAAAFAERAVWLAE